jgi:hypothetical protein
MTGEMEFDLKYLCEDTDRHGNVRLYVRRGKGHPKIRIRALPGTPEFFRAYQLALGGRHERRDVHPELDFGQKFNGLAIV